MTKLIFMGTPEFSATVLKGLLSDDRYEILAVVTQTALSAVKKWSKKPQSSKQPKKQVFLSTNQKNYLEVLRWKPL